AALSPSGTEPDERPLQMNVGNVQEAHLDLTGVLRIEQAGFFPLGALYTMPSSPSTPGCLRRAFYYLRSQVMAPRPRARPTLAIFERRETVWGPRIGVDVVG